MVSSRGEEGDLETALSSGRGGGARREQSRVGEMASCEVDSTKTWLAPIFVKRSLTTRWASSGRLQSLLKCPR